MTLLLAGREKNGATIDRSIGPRRYSVTCACGETFTRGHSSLAQILRDPGWSLRCAKCTSVALSQAGKRGALKQQNGA